MIDVRILSENYSRLTNDQLIRLCENEGHLLESAALTTLYKEFLRRKLSTSIIAAIRVNKIKAHEKELETQKKRDAEEFWEKVWTYCFEAKENNKSDHEIFEGLLEFGFNGDECFVIIKSIEGNAEKMKKVAVDLIHSSLLRIVLATSVLFYLAFSASELKIGALIWIILFVGARDVFRAYHNKSKFTTILRNIKD
jgi:hypothetical protein